MSSRLDRLFRPRSIAVLGGGWAQNVIEQCIKAGYAGDLWPVHPRHSEVNAVRCYPTLAALPSTPDAVFLGINRHATIDAVRELRSMDAGGAVCFASGFSEAVAEDSSSANLQKELILAAGEMPIIGPNCYGLINYLDGALLWPDQHGGGRVESGVAIITQSSNIAINLTMQQRGLPISYVLTAGNQAQLSIGHLGCAILDDDRVTALALHIEGFGDLEAFEQMAAKARALGKPVVALKIGRSDQAQKAMISHTNSLSSSNAASDAFLNRLGIARVHSLSVMIETLKLLQVTGPLKGASLQSMSCSGGEASLMSDAVVGKRAEYLPLTSAQRDELRQILGPLVALANPLDYHTFIWNDLERMTRTFTAVLRAQADMSLLILDFPRADRCEYPSWLVAIDALAAAARATGAQVGVLASLPENLPEEIAVQLIEKGIVPFCGIDDAISAVDVAVELGEMSRQVEQPPVLKLIDTVSKISVVCDAKARSLLTACGLNLPATFFAKDLTELSSKLAGVVYPVVLKGTGITHKTEAGAVVVGLNCAEDVLMEAEKMSVAVIGFQVESFISDSCAELLVSVVRDSALGLMLTLASGGVMTELLKDRVHLLLPFDEVDVANALTKLMVNQLLSGYRGKPAANRQAIVDSVMALQTLCLDHLNSLQELEINPLICGTKQAIVADVLLTMTTIDTTEEAEEHHDRTIN